MEKYEDGSSRGSENTEGNAEGETLHPSPNLIYESFVCIAHS